MTKHIAGHAFQDAPGGQRCINCGASWLFVRSATAEDIGKVDFGHGTLTNYAFSEIEAARTAEENALWMAVSDAASSGSR